eukprot:263662_1
MSQLQSLHNLSPTLKQGSPSPSPNQINPQNPSQIQSWLWVHTFTVLLIRIITDFVFKNPLVFYMDYSNGLSVEMTQFAIILMASEVGCIVALFFSKFNQKCLKSQENIMITYLIISAIACILFPMPYVFQSMLHITPAMTVTWCCICRFFVGISFAFTAAASINFASQHETDPSKISSLIAILHYSWPISTVLNIVVGYIIQDASWIFVFIISGIVLFLVALQSYYVFRYWALSDVTDTALISSFESDPLITTQQTHGEQTGDTLLETQSA